MTTAPMKPDFSKTVNAVGIRSTAGLERPALIVNKIKALVRLKINAEIFRKSLTVESRQSKVLADERRASNPKPLKENMTTAKNLEQALKNLKKQHKTDWRTFSAKMDGVLTVLGNRMSAEGTKELGRPVTVKWNTTEDITDHVSTGDFVAAGFSQDEAEAMIFVLTEDCMGQAVNNLEMVERYFCYCLK